jgi:hypothetical protein
MNDSSKLKYTRKDMNSITLHGKFARNIISIINREIIDDTGLHLKPGTKIVITVIE